MFHTFALNDLIMKTSQACIRAYADEVQINNCRTVLNDNADTFSELSRILSLAGNEVRLKILFLLEEEKELCPCDLADILGMSTPAISQHLRKLKDGGLIFSRRDGQTLYYALKAECLPTLKPFFKKIRNTSVNVTA